MQPYLDAFVPAIGLLALGVALRRWVVRDAAVWAGIERLIFYVLMPALLASAISTLDLATLPIGRMALAIWLALGIGATLSLAFARVQGLPHATMTSVLQGGIRFNNLIGFVVAGGLYGGRAAALAAVATGLIVPFVQLASALAFAAAPGAAPLPLWRVLGRALLNPLLLGCVAGFALALLGGLPPGLAPLARTLGQGALSLGMLAVGAALTAGALRARVGQQLTTASIKLGLVPLATWGLGRLLGLDALPLAVAVVFMALPTATTSYVMSRALGGDAPLMAAIITSQHFLAMVTLPLWIAILNVP